jgi:hypothetical protein
VSRVQLLNESIGAIQPFFHLFPNLDNKLFQETIRNQVDSISQGQHQSFYNEMARALIQARIDGYKLAHSSFVQRQVRANAYEKGILAGRKEVLDEQANFLG